MNVLEVAIFYLYIQNVEGYDYEFLLSKCA